MQIKIAIILIALAGSSALVNAQGFVSYFTGNADDVTTQPIGGVCLMGGATESDDAIRWFLERADGGDILVLRASGSDGYNDYFYSELGISVNSVETIVFQNGSAAFDPYVHERIQLAEAIWIAGGDQWNYVNYWRNTPVDSLIDLAIAERNIVIGGTSAGMAVLGGVYFTAENGTISSDAALAAPFSNDLTLSNEPFLHVPGLESVVTDTHYDNPDRRGRHTVFLARAASDLQVTDVLGIGCDEYTAVCIDTDGMARVFGEWPQFDDFAYFVMPNCLTSGTPELLQPGIPLTWDHDQTALTVCKIPGTEQGDHSFDMHTRLDSDGGTWERWYVQSGQFSVTTDIDAPDCATNVSGPASSFRLVTDVDGRRYGLLGVKGVGDMHLFDALGRTIERRTSMPDETIWLDVPTTGMLFLEVRTSEERSVFRLTSL